MLKSKKFWLIGIVFAIIISLTVGIFVGMAISTNKNRVEIPEEVVETTAPTTVEDRFFGETGQTSKKEYKIGETGKTGASEITLLSVEQRDNMIVCNFDFKTKADRDFFDNFEKLVKAYVDGERLEMDNIESFVRDGIVAYRLSDEEWDVFKIEFKGSHGTRRVATFEVTYDEINK